MFLFCFRFFAAAAELAFVLLLLYVAASHAELFMSSCLQRHICMYVRMYPCMHVCKYVCMYVSMYACATSLSQQLGSGRSLQVDRKLVRKQD